MKINGKVLFEITEANPNQSVVGRIKGNSIIVVGSDSKSNYTK